MANRFRLRLRLRRIVNWNVNGRLKSRSARVAIARILASLSPDILCLQEVSTRAEARWLAAALGLRFDDRWWHRGGMTILSRWPLRGGTVCSIPHSYFNGLVTVNTGGLRVAVVHLDSRRYLHSERRRWSETRFILDRFVPDAARPSIIAGDWNSITHLDFAPCSGESCETPERGRWCKWVRDVGRLPSRLLEVHGWRDAHQGQGHARTTWMPALDAHPRCTPERIDRIYVGGPVRGISQQRTLGPADFAHLFAPHTPHWPTGKDHLIVAVSIRF